MIASAFIFFTIVFFGLFFDRLNIFFYCILSSVLHETGHIIAYIFSYKKIPEISISIFGFKLKNNFYDSRKNLIILICGPLINIIIVLVCFISLENAFKLNVYILFCVNLIIAIINLLPIHYLDGGRIYDLIFKNYYKYTNLLSIISLVSFIIVSIIITKNLLPTIFSVCIFCFYYILNVD